jgi:ketosteroid isomerase-like protein
MREAETQIARRVFEAFNSEDVERVLELTHDEFEVAVPPQLSAEPDVYRGHEGMRRYFESFQEVMREIRFRSEGAWQGPRGLVLAMVITAKGRHTEIAVEQRLAGVWRMRDGKVVNVRVFLTLEEAFEAAGVTAAGGES